MAANPGRHILQSASLACRARGICTTRLVQDKAPAARRFWRTAGVDERGGKYVVTLDDRPIKTPNGTQVQLAPSQQTLAWLMAGEWETQTEFIGAHSLPLTSLVCRSIDGLSDPAIRADVVDKLLKYFHTDSACLHEKYPHVLVELQQRHYMPIVDWARKEYGIEISLTSDMFALQQTKEATETLRSVLAAFSPLKLAALEKATMAAKSLLIGLALVEHHVTAEDAALAAQVETNSQTQLWGHLENAHDLDNAALRQTLGASACVTIGA
ncbi:chaperone [Coemansia furcata]|uniref:Chaperone n=1 Tax=Coemansia furcata TaxID=417177 RepID=A0ACC1LN52_9FUNG|nr:chaperone [Coemansia furcata]